jgi:hypothetical protein
MTGPVGWVERSDTHHGARKPVESAGARSTLRIDRGNGQAVPAPARALNAPDDGGRFRRETGPSEHPHEVVLRGDPAATGNPFGQQ